MALSPTLAHLISTAGLPATFGVVALESLGLPVPGETTIILAAGAAADGELNIYAVALTAFVAAVLGDNIGYLVGRKLGRAAVLRLGGRVGITEEGLARAERVAARWGPLMVAGARFFVVLRQLNGLVAGTTGMHWARFLVANMIGAALWVGLWCTLAYRFGRTVEHIPGLWHHLSLAAGLLVPLLVVAALVTVLRRRRRR